MKIFIIRHGQTTSDVEDRFGGDYDDHLTPLGISQVEELAGKLENSGIEALFVSSRIRTQETAEILNKKLNAKVVTEPDFRERNLYGPLTGMVKSEAKEKHPDLVERIKNTDDTIEGAENKDKFVKRVVEAFWKVTQTGNNTVAIITHGGVIRRIYSELLGVKKESHEIKIADCAFAVLEVEEKNVKIVDSDGVEVLDLPDIYHPKK